MRLAICNELFQDWPLAKAFSYARDAGFEGIEFAPFTLSDDADVRSISPVHRATLRDQLAAAHQQAVGLHWLLAKTEGLYLTSPDETVRRRTGEYLIELTDLCADLGGTVMVLGSPLQRNLLPGVSHEQAMAFAADVIRVAEPTMRERGVILALEPLGPAEGDFLNTAASGIQLAKMVNSPNVRLHLDVKAMSTESQSIPDIIRHSAEWLQHFHANDPNLLGPGMGEVDFEPIIAALDEVGYQGWLTVEVFDDSPGIEAICEASVATLRRCLDRIAG